MPSPRGRPGWPSAPRRCDPGEFGPPSGGRRRGDVRTPARLVVALSAPPVPPWDVRPAGRADVQRPGVQCPRVRCPGVQCPVSRRSVFRCPDGQACAVRGNAAARSASRWTWSGWVWGAAGWAQWVEVPPVSAGGWSPASGLTGSDGAAVGRARLPRGRPSPRADAWPASRLRRRLAAGPTRAGPGPGCRPGGGARDAAGAHRSPRRASGRSPAWCPTMGLDQEVVTTLGGRKARGGPVASSSGGPTRFGGEQPAAAARPRCVRSAAR
jgi:hypothetical protein